MKIKRICLLLVCLTLGGLLIGCNQPDPYPPVSTSVLNGSEVLSEGKEGNYFYALYAGYAEITGYDGEGTSLVLPASLGGKPVRSIGEYAFTLNDKLESVTLPASLLLVGRFAFQDCTALTTVHFNDSLEYIEDFAFRRSGLTELKLPPKLYSIGREAFLGTAITKVEMPETLTRVKEYAFQSCAKLTEVVFSPRVTALENRLFNGCSSLREVIVPTRVTKIGDYVFGSCASLETLVIPESVTELGEGIFAASGKVTVTAKAEGEITKWCSRNAVPFRVTTEEEWQSYYPENET